MTRGATRTYRTFAILCLLFLTAWVQSSALSAENEHHGPADHCCLLCHAGPLPLVQAAAGGMLLPRFAVAWVIPAPRLEAARPAQVSSRSSRAPPA